MGLVEKWQRIESSLPADWADARLELAAADDARGERAAALLAPLMPGRSGKRIRFFTARRGAGPSPEAVRRALRRLDEEGIAGELTLIGSGRGADAVAPPKRTLVEQWDGALAALPPDWSDVYAEVELTSSDYYERAALLMAPLNPARFGGVPGFRFRVARRFGYGASPEMTRRCFERLDAEGIPGEVRVLHALSDSRPVDTQGPVWHVGGKTV